ncbi:MAG TPA: SCO family protein [Xanthobacteraceae bacterium]|nr:SCO family protein [Xanthobacteraceae bacterium]
MSRSARERLGLVARVGAGLLALAALLLSPVAAVANGAFDDLALRPHPGERLPLATRLRDEQNRAVALGDYFTKSPVVLVLDYLRCTSLCGVTLRNLVDALDRLPLEPARDYQLVAVSIDPRDTPTDAAAARRKYAALLDRPGAESGLHFLTTPSADAAHDIAEAVGFPYRYDTLSDAYIHPAGFVVVSPTGRISRYVEGVAISPPALVGALADAEQNKSEGPLTRLLLFCHAQVGRLGRLTVPVLTAFTIANLAAGLGLLVLFAVIWRRAHG